MDWTIIIFGVLTMGYAGLLVLYRQTWILMPENKTPPFFKPTLSITILIPARNEAEKIGVCLRAIIEGNYPQNLLEIIVLDDFSEDETCQVVRNMLQVARVLRMADHLPPEAKFTPNKKKAIELGVSRAKGEIIVTTDADCEVPINWLRQLAFAFENPATQLVCAPVLFHREKNLLQRFQSLDFLGMMGIAGAGYQLNWHQMANGANLAYRKTAFAAVGGYSGNEYLASGDDMFLVQKVESKWPGSVAFFKSREAAVLTEPAPELRAFWNQRLRWGTKNAALPSWPLRLSLLTAFLFCWSIWVNLLLTLANAFEGIFAQNFYLLVFQIGVKATCDYLFLSEMCCFFNRKDLLRWFWPSFMMHTVYIVVIGTGSIFFKSYTWKGRHAN